MAGDGSVALGRAQFGFRQDYDVAMADRSESSSSPADHAMFRNDQIVDAALRLFARYGRKRSSMDDIAREAGLAKATLYLHFKGKDDVFRAMLGLLGRRASSSRSAVVGRLLRLPASRSA